MSKLKIVTKNVDSNGSLYIGGTTNYPYIAYNTTDEEGSIIVSVYKKSPYRPIHCSELYNKLKSRAWNKVDGCRFIVPQSDNSCRYFIKEYNCEDNNMGVKSYNLPTKDIDTISDMLGQDGELSDKGKMTSFELQCENLDDVSEIKETYDELYGDTNYNSELYKSVHTTFNSIGNTSSIELISYDSDVYTDAISLNPFMSISSKNGTSCLAKLTIQYTKLGNIYTHDSSILAFEYDSSDSIIKENFIESINDEVNLEYINGVLRVYPLSSSIDECIIANCTLRYGK